MAVLLNTGADLNNQRAVNVASPSSGTDATNKTYVDNLVAGLSWKDEVRVATTTTGTLASAYANASTVDGITLATGDRILIKDQSTASENGIYVVGSSGAPTRATDADATAEMTNATVFITDGTVNSGRAYTQTTKNPTLGSSSIVWSQFGAGSTYTAGNGLALSSGSFSVLLDTNPGLTVSGTGVKVASTISGAGLTLTAGVLDVGAGTGISVAADSIAVDTSVVARKYSTTIGDGAATSYTVTHNLGTRSVVTSIALTATPWTVVYADVANATTNTVTVAFATAPASGAYTVTVTG